MPGFPGDPDSSGLDVFRIDKTRFLRSTDRNPVERVGEGCAFSSVGEVLDREARTIERAKNPPFLKVLGTGGLEPPTSTVSR